MAGTATNPWVTVSIVTYNSRRYIRQCLEAVLQQEYHPLEVIVVDNASEDGCDEILLEFQDRIRILFNNRNKGFAASQNQAIALSRGVWILTLNPDVRLAPDFVARLVAAGQSDAAIGTVCGRLLRANPDLSIPRQARIDSTGLYFTPNLRHFDRGWNEPDDGRFRQAEYVFGATAAAAFYRREMITDIALEDGFFDPDFFTYREDADVAWRAQLLGWRCLYVPEALAHHVRRVFPHQRGSVPAVLRMHSVKNRFLMRIKNATADLYRRRWLHMTMRDLVVVGGCLFREPASLAAFWHLARCLSRTLVKRREIMRRRKASDDVIAEWFRPHPVSRPWQAAIGRGIETDAVVRVAES